ncbi:MAG: sigma-54-dependent Fis family transcriptional regulator [Planctomycetes bacterium]|nr:sigma-54-dependent Fis family transcriptional regulator [Planctomycetota bacterium]
MPNSQTVILIASRQAEAPLRRAGRPTRKLSSIETALDDPDLQGAAAVVLSGQALKKRDVAKTLKDLRGRAPRATIVVWGPDLRSGVVRACLMNGATDVVLEASPETLAESLLADLEQQLVLPPLERLQRTRQRGRPFHGLASRSDAMWDMFETCVRVGPTDAAVLILGETGTGKERLARAIHALSKRPGRWVAVNCGAVPESLLESELFGHEKGAFTGATRAKTGLFRHADGGTLFLDEVGNMPLEAQFSLLRTLQEGTVRPVGAQEQIPVDVRIVAATNSELETAVARGTFREDLLYRLDVIRLDVPALRERPEDILFLFSHFARELSRQHVREFPELTDGFTSALLEHPWPGNVRELENFVERLLLTHRGKPLGRRDFNRLKRGAARPAPGGPSVGFDPDSTLADAVEDAERRYLRGALQHYRGRVQETADAIGVNRRTLLRKLKKHGLDRREFRDT